MCSFGGNYGEPKRPWYVYIMGYKGYSRYKGYEGYKQQPQPQPQPHHHQQWRRPAAASTKVGGRFAAAHLCGFHCW
jgi:hypothetical protein